MCAVVIEQRAAHGFAWVATSVAALEAVHGWLERNGDANPIDAKVAQLAFAETVSQLICGLPMSQNEIFRPGDAESIKLSRHSAALRLLQYVRDESHRFAQHYHHMLRRKRLTEE